MASERKASIDLEAIEEKSLNQVSAADFLTALGASGRRGATVMKAWPEKKKYELLLEPEFTPDIKVGALINKLGEKKKYELEKPHISELFHKAVGSEVEYLNPREQLIDPVVLAREIAKQLNR